MAASTSPCMKIVIQHCNSAQLLTNNVDQYVQINKGAILYVCFLKGITQKVVEKAVKELRSGKIFRETAGDGTSAGASKPVTLFDVGCDLLVIPQASIAGKLKSKTLQHHNQVDKVTGKEMWQFFLTNLASSFSDASAPKPEKPTPPEDPSKQATISILGEKEGENPLEGCNGFVLPSQKNPERILAFGTYGNRQGLKFESDGPFTLVFEW